MSDEPEIRELLNAAPRMDPLAKAKAEKLARIMAQMVAGSLKAPAKDEPEKDTNE